MKTNWMITFHEQATTKGRYNTNPIVRKTEVYPWKWLAKLRAFVVFTFPRIGVTTVQRHGYPFIHITSHTLTFKG